VISIMAMLHFAPSVRPHSRQGLIPRSPVCVLDYQNSIGRTSSKIETTRTKSISSNCSQCDRKAEVLLVNAFQVIWS